MKKKNVILKKVQVHVKCKYIGEKKSGKKAKIIEDGGAGAWGQEKCRSNDFQEVSIMMNPIDA
jgi:hypothetical protein